MSSRSVFVIAINILVGLISQHIAYGQSCDICNAATCGQIVSDFSYLDGTNEVCDGAAKLVVNNSDTTDISFAVWCWGDGSPNDTIYSNYYEPISHIFSIPEDEVCDNQVSSFAISLTIYRICNNGRSCNFTSRGLSVIHRPKADFDISDTPCVGNPVCITEQGCNATSYNLSINPGNASYTDATPCHTFTSGGTYTLTRRVENACDDDTFSRTINVLDLPVANAVLDSGSVVLQGGVYSVCLSDGGRVRFNADGSQFETSYNWTISPSSGYTWQGNRMNDTTFVQFSAPGVYTVTLQVDNPCQQPDEASFTVEVLPALSLNLAPQADGCLTLSYTPTIVPGATYTLNGVAYTEADFPRVLTTSPTPYILTAMISNICDTITQRDTFFVFGQSDPTITAPAMDSSICRDTTLLLLETDSPGGVWSVSSGLPLVVQNGQTFFSANQPNGAYTLTYSLGFGACQGTDTRTLTINSPSITLSPLSLCEDTPPTLLTATPPGGRWQGMGITDEIMGVFDPVTVVPGVYTVTYTFMEMAVGGCTVTNTTTVEVVALPTANNVPDTYSVCNVDTELSLPMLTGITFSPNTGTVVWVGEGITNSGSGAYNPANVGAGTDTVSFSYTVGPGCTIRDTFIVSIDSITPVDAGADRTLCDSDMNPILAATPTGGRWSGPGIDAVTGAINLAALTAGQTYTYTYTINANIPSCENSDAVNITIAPGQGVSLAFDEVFVCDTASVVALPAGAPASGIWSGATSISGGQVDISTWTPGTYTLTYTISTLPLGCNAANFTIHLATQPTVGIISDTTACVDVDCLPFMAASADAAAFLWQFGDGTTATGPNTCHTYTTQGTFAVGLTGYLVNPNTNARYCASAPAILEVDILGVLPPIGIDLSSTQGCPELLVDLTPTSIVPYARYTWTTVGITDSVAAALFNVSFPATTEDTTYQVQMTVTNGCTTDVQTATVTALAPLRAVIGTEYDLPCNGETIALFNRSTGMTGTSTPMWSSSDGWTYQGVEPPPFQVFTDSLPRLLTFTLIDANTCNADTAIYTIEIQPTDVRARMNYSEPEICLGASLLLINQSTPGAAVRWVTSDGINYVGDTLVHRFQQLGPAWVDIFAFGCGYDSTRYYFDVLPAPELDLDYDSFVCAQAAATFTVVGNAASTVLHFGNGDSTVMNIGIYTYPIPGSYTMRLIGRSVAGCLDSLQRDITILPLPIPVVAPPDSVCAGETVDLISNSINTQSCEWRLAGSGFRDQCATTYVFSQSGLQVNRLIVTSAQGCRDSIDFPVYVRPTPVPAFTALGSDACSPAIVSFIFTSSDPQPTAWLWNFGDGAISTEVNPSHTYALGGDYRIQLTVSIDGICTQSVIETLSVKGTPQVMTVFTDERCLPTDNFIVEVLTDEDNEVTITGPNFIQQGINRFDIPFPGDYTLEVISPLGCDTTLTFTVPQVFPLQLQLMPDTCIELGASVRLLGQVNATDIDLFWSPGSTLNDSTLLSPIASPLGTTTYTLTVSRNNCLVIDEVLVKVKKPEIYFPNAFSPNDDNINDVYTIYPSIGVETISLFQVWSRWGGGGLICEVKDMDPTEDGIQIWDGAFRGEPLDPGVFVFIAEVHFKDGRVEQFRGNIHLVR